MKFLKAGTIVIFISFLVIGCGNGSDSGGTNCNVVANENGPSFLKVINNLSTGLEWSFINSFPFGADMKPGECISVGLDEGSYTVEINQCTISDAVCILSFGPAKRRTFTLGNQHTHTIMVNNSFF